jgi:antitoxin component of MazEF toxin-antitoxin module
MKTKEYVEKMGKNGEITIPRDYWPSLGLVPGEEVSLKLAHRYVLVEPVKEAVARKKKKNGHPEAAGTAHSLKQLTGILEIDDPGLIDAIVESEDIYG